MKTCLQQAHRGLDELELRARQSSGPTARRVAVATEMVACRPGRRGRCVGADTRTVCGRNYAWTAFFPGAGSPAPSSGDCVWSGRRPTYRTAYAVSGEALADSGHAV